jgi:hypothetical protein
MWQQWLSLPLGTQITAVLVLTAFLKGAFGMLATFLGLLSSVYRQFLRAGKKLKRYGAWAVVTGCTDGIGLEYSQALAKQGSASAQSAARHPIRY